jgi:CRISPR type I-E-associated protein CasB/Cse2
MQKRELDDKITTFTEKLAKLEAGEKARLRRDAGKTLSECQNIGLFYRLLPYGVPTGQEEIYFLVATLYPLLQNGGMGNFGTVLRQVRDSDDKKNKGLNRRVEILLDSDTDQIRFRLRQAMRFVRSRYPKANVNWARLLDDLLRWNNPARYVQQEWAREYFGLSQKSAVQKQDMLSSTDEPEG